VYQIIYGVAPFKPPRAGDSRDLIQFIETKDVDFPPYLEISPELQDLMKRMLVRKPVDRIVPRDIPSRVAQAGQH
jgi:hypothetical protein